jgi:hypothetical protein
VGTVVIASLMPTVLPRESGMHRHAQSRVLSSVESGARSTGVGAFLDALPRARDSSGPVEG